MYTNVIFFHIQNQTFLRHYAKSLRKIVTKVNIQSCTPPILNLLLCWFQNSFFYLVLSGLIFVGLGLNWLLLLILVDLGWPGLTLVDISFLGLSWLIFFFWWFWWILDYLGWSWLIFMDLVRYLLILVYASLSWWFFVDIVFLGWSCGILVDIVWKSVFFNLFILFDRGWSWLILVYID